MENMETIVITWTELFKTDDNIADAKEFIIEQMKKHYEHYERNGITYFKTDVDTTMHICVLRWKTEDSLVMSYHSPDDDDDGDQFYISDYSTPNEMFMAMLEEIKR